MVKTAKIIVSVISFEEPWLECICVYPNMIGSALDSLHAPQRMLACSGAPKHCSTSTRATVSASWRVATR
jgi:hypothetical protein